MQLKIQKGNGLEGEITVPGDKSISHRSLILSSCAIGTSKIVNLLESDDVLSTLEALKHVNDLIYDANDTLENAYIITLQNEDYTIGKIIEYFLYNKYFVDEKTLTYVGFLKKHPHDDNSFIKISSKNLISKEDIIIMIENSVNSSILTLNSIKEYFTDK